MNISDPNPGQAVRGRIPVVVIGGFLGAGKTSLLNHVLQENHGVRAAVLVNDFGAVNIDADLVVDVEGETISLNNGCICCSIRDDLLDACVRLVAKTDPQLVIIETSGVSDPIQVVNGLGRAELQSHLRLDCLLAVVDAEQLPYLAGDSMTLARMQIQAADFVALNKVDLVNAQQLMAVKILVREISPQARIIESRHGRVPLDFILGFRHGEGASDFGREGEHGVHRVDASPVTSDHPFSTFHWQSHRPLSLPRLRAALDKATESVYRAKGILCLEELPGQKIALHLVGKRVQFNDMGAWKRDEQAKTDLVFIGPRKSLDEVEVHDALEDCIGVGDEDNSPVLRLSKRLGLVK